MMFGCRTLYSTEGASQCIRGMLYLLALRAKQLGRKPLIAAGRNAHKTFLTAAALLDLQVQWLYPEDACGYLSCDLTAAQLDTYLEKAEEKPVAVYLTSPDYLGNTADIGALAQVCHKHGALLAVDNAHGAYLRFLPGILWIWAPTFAATPPTRPCQPLPALPICIFPEKWTAFWAARRKMP